MFGEVNGRSTDEEVAVAFAHGHEIRCGHAPAAPARPSSGLLVALLSSFPQAIEAEAQTEIDAHTHAQSDDLYETWSLIDEYIVGNDFSEGGESNAQNLLMNGHD
jgi:hypothetical protein